MTEGSSYELVLTPPAVRAIQSGLPEGVAAAVIEFLTGALIDNPRRVGKPLRGDLAGIHAARRGTYRVLYRINEKDREVIVVRIDHRSDAYRPG
jgi:mRNA interferase RelE/StbE